MYAKTSPIVPSSRLHYYPPPDGGLELRSRAEADRHAESRKAAINVGLTSRTYSGDYMNCWAMFTAKHKCFLITRGCWEFPRSHCRCSSVQPSKAFGKDSKRPPTSCSTTIADDPLECFGRFWSSTTGPPLSNTGWTCRRYFARPADPGTILRCFLLQRYSSYPAELPRLCPA